jgi:transcriptional regulator of met regulon
MINLLKKVSDLRKEKVDEMAKYYKELFKEVKVALEKEDQRKHTIQTI